MMPAMDRTTALIALGVFYILPLVHILLSPSAGPFRPPPGARCPFGPRTGWLVIVVMLGPIGWLIFMLRRRRAPAR